MGFAIFKLEEVCDEDFSFGFYFRLLSDVICHLLLLYIHVFI